MLLCKNMPQAGVYKIVNIIDGKVYIGGTRHLCRRKGGHFWMLKRGIHHAGRLQEAYDIYGRSAFRFEVIQTLGSESDIKKVEQKYIDKYKAYDPLFGYNIAPCSESTKGVPCSERKKALISGANTGKKRSEECKRRQGEITRVSNLNASPETHRRWSEAQRRIQGRPEHRERARQMGLKNRRISDESIAKMIEMRNKGISILKIAKIFKIANTYFYTLEEKYENRKADCRC